MKFIIFFLSHNCARCFVRTACVYVLMWRSFPEPLINKLEQIYAKLFIYSFRWFSEIMENIPKLVNSLNSNAHFVSSNMMFLRIWIFYSLISSSLFSLHLCHASSIRHDQCGAFLFQIIPFVLFRHHFAFGANY